MDKKTILRIMKDQGIDPIKKSGSNQTPKRRKVSADIRKRVYALCSGHCAYCGKQIPISEMQVDHLIPMTFYDMYAVVGCDVDSEDNYLPACRSCNNYKHTLTLEKFREAIERWPDVLMRDSVTYRNAVRFKLVIPRPHKVVFYFEQHGITIPSQSWR